MELPTIEKGDVISTKDGRAIRVLAVYKPAGTIVRVDGVVIDDPSPMRQPIFAKDIARILKKREMPATDRPSETLPAGKLPEGQKVVSKQDVPEAVKKDVASRQRHRTTSAETAEKAHQVKK